MFTKNQMESDLTIALDYLGTTPDSNGDIFFGHEGEFFAAKVTGARILGPMIEDGYIEEWKFNRWLAHYARQVTKKSLGEF